MTKTAWRLRAKMPIRRIWGRVPAAAIAIAVAISLAGITSDVLAQDKTLGPRAAAIDANKNGVIDRNEARGPLDESFSEMDCDRSGALDGEEIRNFFSGTGCPETQTAAPESTSPAPDTTLGPRAAAIDANKNGVIDRDEARGPLDESFSEMDCDRSGALDGAEIRNFFSGTGCPETQTAAPESTGPAPDTTLGPRAAAIDANKNGVIDRDEARGPLDESFNEMDCDKSGALDGAEIRNFFSGSGCPETQTAGRTGATPPGPQPGQASGGSNAQRPRGRPPRSVRVDEVIRETQSQTFPVIGRLVARRAGIVASFIPGAVAGLNFDVGDRVKKRDIIATLAPARLKAARDKFQAARATRDAMVRTAESEHNKKVQELRRMESLRTSSAFSRARYEDLVRDVEGRKAVIAERRSLLKQAEAELKQASIDLANATIRAPYDGVIVEKHTEIGSYVSFGGSVVTMISDSDIEVEAGVPSDLIAGLNRGMAIRVRLDDETEHRSVIRAIVPQENPRTRTRLVRMTPEFGETSKQLAVNQSATAMIPIGKIREVVTVHKDAIVHRNNAQQVYVVRNNRAFQRPVEIGDAVGNRYIVLSGLKPGDVVVVQGNEGLPPGSRIRILTDTLAVGVTTQ